MDIQLLALSLGLTFVFAVGFFGGLFVGIMGRSAYDVRMEEVGRP